MALLSISISPDFQALLNVVIIELLIRSVREQAVCVRLTAVTVFAGSSTACIVVLDRSSHRLHTANLGDSGFLVVRGGEVVHRSDEQQHYFNTPFQLSIAPPEAEGVVLSDR